MVGALGPKLDARPASVVLRVVGGQRELVQPARPSAAARPAPSPVRGLHPRRRRAADSSSESPPDDWGDRLQLRRVSRPGAGDAAALRVHVVRDDERRIRHHAVSGRLLRRRLLFPEPTRLSSRTCRTAITWTSSAATNGCWRPASGTSAARRTNRSPGSCIKRACPTACTSGATARSTTGRAGGRWRRPICPEAVRSVPRSSSSCVRRSCGPSCLVRCGVRVGAGNRHSPALS